MNKPKSTRRTNVQALASWAIQQMKRGSSTEPRELNALLAREVGGTLLQHTQRRPWGNDVKPRYIRCITALYICNDCFSRNGALKTIWKDMAIQLVGNAIQAARELDGSAYRPHGGAIKKIQHTVGVWKEYEFCHPNIWKEATRINREHMREGAGRVGSHDGSRGDRAMMGPPPRYRCRCGKGVWTGQRPCSNNTLNAP